MGGSSLPAVRVELNPSALFKYGIGLEDVRAALAAANANTPKGSIDVGGRALPDLHQRPGEQAPRRLQNAHRRVPQRQRGAAVGCRRGARLGRERAQPGLADGKPAVLVILYRQPGANIIETVDRVTALMPALKASIPADIQMKVAVDRTTTIRASLHDVERTLIVAICARDPGGVPVPAQRARDAGARRWRCRSRCWAPSGRCTCCGYSLDNLSLMALTIATGFVVDDAIVVLENVTRHVEAGMPRFEAALLGASEVGFTVLSMSLSLIAVFIPILADGRDRRDGCSASSR